jgi:hypothetical protein
MGSRVGFDCPMPHPPPDQPKKEQAVSELKLPNCELRISLVTGRDEGDTVDVTIEDRDSSTTFATATLSVEALGQVLLSRGAKCVASVRGLDHVGKMRENKTLTIPCPEWRTKDIEAANGYIAPFEIEGWLGDAKDMMNPHNHVAPNGINTHAFRVTFVRWVPKKE